MIRIKRAYDPPAESDGMRLLVDRYWVRGIPREKLMLDGWPKEVAPSDKLRKWYNHEPEKWDEFCRLYFIELDKNPTAWHPILAMAREQDVTLLFGSKELERNNAKALQMYLEKQQGQQA
jgi:uncharacterized protein YeaO (DUF488 family)